MRGSCTGLRVLGSRKVSMVRADLAGRKIASAEARLRQVEELLGDDEDAFVKDARRADLASFYLFLAI
jgi:hypothetical protein